MLRNYLAISLLNTFAFAAFGQTPSQNDELLSEAIVPLVQAHHGDVAVAIEHLKTNESFHFRGEEPMPTASLIKFPLMVTAYHMAAIGELDLTKEIVLKQEDKVPGSGILTDHFSSGVTLPLRDYIRLMIRDSDNTATNVVIDQVGLRKTAEHMEKLGLMNTKLHSKVYRGDTSVFVERSKQFGIGSTTADEMVSLLKMLQQQKLADETNTKVMMGHLAACDDPTKLGRYLPAESKLFHKTGAIGNCRTDAGIIETATGPVAVCVLTNKNADQSWGDENEAEILCSKIGRVVAERFGLREESTAIRYGSTGLLVESLQRTLNERLKPTPGLGVDGDFGPATDTAVKRFQKENGLESTGVLDEATWKALGTLVEEEGSTVDVESFNSEAEKAAKQPMFQESDPPFVTCDAWIIADGVTGKKLQGFNENVRRHPASTTKVMTGYLVAQMIAKDPIIADEWVTFSKGADETIGSSSGIRAGEKVRVKDLLYGLLLPSGNDAAVAFAEHFGKRLQGVAPENGEKPFDAFLAEMNRAAKSLGMESTHFNNPHGLPHPEHLTTASDLVRLSHSAMQDSLIRKVVSTRQFACNVQSDQGYRRNVVWGNTNQLLEIEGFDGVKTGTTDAAGACLVATGTMGQKQRMIVILGSSDSEARYVDIKNLFRWEFAKQD